MTLSRNDRASLEYAQSILERHRELGLKTPIVLVANKADLPEEDKDLSLDQCHELALTFGVLFFELSVSESPLGVRLVLMALLSELVKSVSGYQGKRKMLSTSTRRIWMKVFGALFKSITSGALPSSPRKAQS